MFLKYIRNFLLSIVYFQLTIGSSLAYAEVSNIDTHERTKEIINDFIKNANPSDLPFVDYLDTFVHDKTQPIKRFDLSNYNGKQIYVGYGLYDADQKYCRYIEQPGLDPDHNAQDKITNHFNLISSFNKHQYAISINKMTFQQCQDIANKFGVYIASPTSLAENGFLNGRFSIPSGNKKWLGIEKSSCSQNDPYMNQEGKEQEYFKWSMYEHDSAGCDPSKLKVSQNEYGTWNKQTGHELNYCLIESDSEDINRPIKVCAPWWRIERDYKKEFQTDWGGINIYRINQADIPAQSVVCTKMDTEALQEAYEDKETRRITCTTYYDATRAPECLHDPMQPQCYVDECSGYVENACVHVQEITPYKDYTKTKAIVDGQLQWIKGKTNIRTQVYDCPPSPPSLKKSCLETSTVVIYPKECPGSQCQELKECTYNAKTKEEKDDCFAQFKCKKIYGSPDLPVYDANGKLTNLKGYCTDENGNNIEPPLIFDLNIQNKHERKCLEYEEYTITKHVNQNCELERPYTDHTVEMSITGVDIYEDNPMCIRLNNVSDARPLQELTLDYFSKGFAKVVIKKAFINGLHSGEVEDGRGDYVLSPGAISEEDQTGQEDFNVTVNQQEIDCSDFSTNWTNKIGAILEKEPESITSSSYDGNFSDTNIMKVKFFTETSNDCDFKKGEIPTAISNSFDNDSKECSIFYPKEVEDRKFKFIQGEDPTTFISETQETRDECRRYATCIGGAYNENDYIDNRPHECIINAGSDYSAPESDPVIPPTASPRNCKPNESSGSLKTQFYGDSDIFFIEEVVDGAFGYYSNHTTWPYLNNIVKYEDKELSPIKPITTIEDHLIYEGIFYQISILTKKPNILAGAIGGAAAGGGAYQMGAMTSIGATGIGLIVLVVFVLVAAIFGPKKKYNEQYNFWIIYKLVPVIRYIDNVYGYDYRIMTLDTQGNRKIYQTDKGNVNGINGIVIRKILENLGILKIHS